MARLTAQETSVSRIEPDARSTYRQWRTMTTRWMDNDVYGHVNNVVYYGWFDTAVNAYLIEAGALDVEHSPVIGLVVQTQCHYFEPLAFPQTVETGLRVAHLGRSSVRYEIGVFAQGQSTCAARGHFVHVYVDRASLRPAQLPAALREALVPLLVEPSRHA
jgi:acyl-CoA thioester hydrolase